MEIYFNCETAVPLRKYITLVKMYFHLLLALIPYETIHKYRTWSQWSTAEIRQRTCRVKIYDPFQGRLRRRPPSRVSSWSSARPAPTSSTSLSTRRSSAPSKATGLLCLFAVLHFACYSRLIPQSSNLINFYFLFMDQSLFMHI